METLNKNEMDLHDYYMQYVGGHPDTSTYGGPRNETMPANK